MRRVPDATLFAEVLTEWVWMRLADGRATSVPRELLDLAAEVTRKTLSGRRGSHD